MSLDPLWRSFLNYVNLNGGWKGPNIPWDPREPVDEQGGYDKEVREMSLNDLSRHMEMLALAGADEDDDGANIDRPWRELE